ncbi:expansin EXLX1 family cellulose-binding protein [Fibrobacterota bacterium]
MKPAIFIFLIAAACLAAIDYDAGEGPGRITYYEQSPTVACDIPQSEWPAHTAALDEAHFQGGLACGASALLANEGNEIQVMVVDLCPVQGNEQWCSGDMTHFDLGGTSTFSLLEPVVTGVKELEFQWVPTPVGDTPVKLRFKDGINQWWVAIQVINHRYPVANLEIQDPQSGAWLAGNRTNPGMWNYWQFDFSNGLQPPFQIRITDQYGQTIEETGTVVQENYLCEGQNQFPLLARHGGDVPVSPPPVKPTSRVYINGNRLYGKIVAPVKIEIRNPSGKLIASPAPSMGQGYIELPRLPAGIYHVRVSASGFSRTLLWLSGLKL